MIIDWNIYGKRREELNTKMSELRDEMKEDYIKSFKKKGENLVGVCYELKSHQEGHREFVHILECKGISDWGILKGGGILDYRDIERSVHLSLIVERCSFTKDDNGVIVCYTPPYKHHYDAHAPIFYPDTHREITQEEFGTWRKIAKDFIKSLDIPLKHDKKTKKWQEK